MNDNTTERLLEDKELDKAVRKSKYRSAIKITLISLVIAVTVFLVLNIISLKVTKDSSREAYEEIQDEIRLRVPNGYINKIVFNDGFFGGTANYTVCRHIADKNINLERRDVAYGIIKPRISTGGATIVTSSAQVLFDPDGKMSYSTRIWPSLQWENGYNMMIFFSPQFKYTEYKNDLKYLEQLASDRLIEVGISFDKPYSIKEIRSFLSNIPQSWYWVGSKRPTSSYVIEPNTIGMSSINNSSYAYTDLLERLKQSKDAEYNNVYKELISKGYTDISKLPILGAIVYGTKDELKPLVGNPHIKASSFGVITSRY